MAIRYLPHRRSRDSGAPRSAAPLWFEPCAAGRVGPRTFSATKFPMASGSDNALIVEYVTGMAAPRQPTGSCDANWVGRRALSPGGRLYRLSYRCHRLKRSRRFVHAAATSASSAIARPSAARGVLFGAVAPPVLASVPGAPAPALLPTPAVTPPAPPGVVVPPPPPLVTTSPLVSTA